MTDTDTYVQRLAVTNPLIEPTLHSAIQALQLTYSMFRGKGRHNR